MRSHPNLRRRLLAGVLLLGAAGLLAGCAGRNTESLEEARRAVARAEADQAVVTLAPGKLDEAQQALARTESAFAGRAPQVELDHYAYLTRQRAAIAHAAADESTALAEIEGLTAEQDRLMLDEREREIESLEAELAALQAQQTDRGLVVTLGDILFDFDEAELTPGGELQVARLADALRQMPDRNVLIEGHTDSSGSDSYNLELSQRRANAVEDLLIIQGVDPTRILTRGYGEQYPVVANDSAAGRQQNRRVEVVILEPGQAGVPRS
jgi:outer membrane protein OmpA-like peptidoglycan-associated protein